MTYIQLEILSVDRLVNFIKQISVNEYSRVECVSYGNRLTHALIKYLVSKL